MSLASDGVHSCIWPFEFSLFSARPHEVRFSVSPVVDLRSSSHLYASIISTADFLAET